MRISLGLVVLLAACVAASAQAVPDAPAAPDARNSAAKLAGLAGFVNMACTGIRTDTERLRSAVEALGVGMKDLEQGELRLRAQGYIDAYRKDPTASCERAQTMFGPTGTVIPGVFVAR
ncbi:hypothetical protein Q8W71_14680 [Methylobacterium sp. NEAU 140]|uniref:hypothetical protein n=1 Tax=Methylobacterium sp. NEAU 140 TaxID=3064945 RepID=UPI0027373305|nr:hypothetical protein [Methylobacterium sp. NEAU 140]MDP4023878.1 hypothetical protein [Methylobacterium sp. NEAU 140]